MKIVATIGLDIAKQVFQVDGADKSEWRVAETGKVARFFSEIPPCLPAAVHIIGRGSATFLSTRSG